MKNDTNTLRKQIAFHTNRPEEVHAYEMIDKVRYYQTEFIAKMANDFFEKHGLTQNSPYELIQSVVRSYISGSLSDDEKSKAVSPTDNAILMMLQMQSAMIQQINAQQMSLMNTQKMYPLPEMYSNSIPQNSSMQNFTPPVTQPISNTEAVQPNIPSEKVHVDPIQNNSNPSVEPMTSIDDELEDDDMDEDLSKLAAGFSSMIQ